jgi:hypothetical protein
MMGVIKRFAIFIVIGLLFALPMGLLYHGILQHNVLGLFLGAFACLAFLCIAFNVVTFLEYVIKDKLFLCLAVFLTFGFVGVCAGLFIGDLPFPHELLVQPTAFVYWGAMVFVPFLVSSEPGVIGNRSRFPALKYSVWYFAGLSSLYLVLAIVFAGTPYVWFAIALSTYGTLVLAYFYLKYFLSLKKSKERKNTKYLWPV